MEKCSDKQIYIIVSQTGTMLSKILKYITGKQYNHASIGLSEDLKMMYSFGRLHPYNPFWGGFVAESTKWGTLKRFHETEAVILKIDITEELHREICETVYRMFRERRKYHYNYLGLWLAAFHIHYRSKNRFYCSEFVGDILKRYNIEGSDRLSKIIHPTQFLNMPYTPIYSGKLKDYSANLRSKANFTA